MKCEACDRPTKLLIPFPSVLDFDERQVCGECVDHHAERESVVALMGRAAIELLPLHTSQAVHVFDGVRYLTLGEWQDQSRKPAPDLEPVAEPDPKTERVDDEEDDDDLLRLMNISKRVAEPLKSGLLPTVWAS